MVTFDLEAIARLFPDCRLEKKFEAKIHSAVGIMESIGKNMVTSVSWVNDQNSQRVNPSQIELGLLILSSASYALLKSASSNFLISENPRAIFSKLIATFFKETREARIESSAKIDPSARVGSNCYIGHNVIIEKDCVIGSNTVVLHNTAILRRTIIGNYVTIGCNNTIGNYGFGYERDEDDDYQLLEHMGNVIIHDNVEIHNNTCIDRGVMGSTEIFENVKIDNLVHIAHGVKIGRNSLIIANAMIGGSVIIGEDCWVAPSVSVKNKVTIARKTFSGLGAVVLKNTNENETYIGNPAITMEEYKTWSETRKKLLKGD